MVLIYLNVNIFCWCSFICLFALIYLAWMPLTGIFAEIDVSSMAGGKEIDG